MPYCAPEGCQVKVCFSIIILTLFGKVLVYFQATPQGTILGQVVFDIFINNLNVGLEAILSKFADDTKLAGAVDSFKSKKSLKRDLDKLDGWAISNCMKLNKGKCQILHLEWGNSGYMDRLEKRLESSSEKRDLGVLVDGKLNVRTVCPGATRINHILGCIRQSIASCWREVIFPLYSALVQPHLKSCVHFWAHNIRNI